MFMSRSTRLNDLQSTFTLYVNHKKKLYHLTGHMEANKFTQSHYVLFKTYGTSH